ncbi:MAG TPA: hypothetical protein VI322_03265 [Candidatus Saccharimonadia bacterium]
MTTSLQAQLRRIETMDEMLYDDKLSGEISKERYAEKHAQLKEQHEGVEEQLSRLDASMSERLEQRMVIVELSQKAAESYLKKPSALRRVIISKLFEKLTLKGGVLSVKYSSFAQAIASAAEKTQQLMES